MTDAKVLRRIFFFGLRDRDSEGKADDARTLLKGPIRKTDGDVSWRDKLGLTNDEGALHRVSQFPHVPPPWMRQKNLLRLGVN